MSKSQHPSDRAPKFRSGLGVSLATAGLIFGTWVESGFMLKEELS